MLKNFFFGFVPKSPTQMGSLSAKNASKKFSRLGTFKGLIGQRGPLCLQDVLALAEVACV